MLPCFRIYLPPTAIRTRPCSRRKFNLLLTTCKTSPIVNTFGIRNLTFTCQKVHNLLWILYCDERGWTISSFFDYNSQFVGELLLCFRIPLFSLVYMHFKLAHTRLKFGYWKPLNTYAKGTWSWKERILRQGLDSLALSSRFACSWTCCQTGSWWHGVVEFATDSVGCCRT